MEHDRQPTQIPAVVMMVGGRYGAREEKCIVTHSKPCYCYAFISIKSPVSVEGANE